MTSNVVGELLSPLLYWTERGGDAWEMDVAYWRRRDELLPLINGLPPNAQSVISEIEGALDVFSPAFDRNELQIDEAQLRDELIDSIGRLVALGYIVRP